MVIKVGGSEGIDYRSFCEEVAELWHGGQRMVLVHGGSTLTNQVAEKMGHPPQFVTSPSGYTSRYTDRRTMEIFQMVYCGQMNKTLVEYLQGLDVNAMGLSGMDGGLWQARHKAHLKVVEQGRTRILRDNLTGRVEQVNTALLHSLLDSGYLPVLTPPALSHEGLAVNVDGDRAAAMTASGMKATELLLLSNVPGLLRDLEDENSLVKDILLTNLEEAGQLAKGRMRIKLLGAREALRSGVEKVILGDARHQGPICQALSGQGTTIWRN